MRTGQRNKSRCWGERVKTLDVFGLVFFVVIINAQGITLSTTIGKEAVREFKEGVLFSKKQVVI